MTRPHVLLACGIIGLLATMPALARSIELSDIECDLLAAIHEEAPLLSWAASGQSGTYTNDAITFESRGQRGKQAFLLRFPLAGRIPEGMRIVRAELMTTATTVWPEQAQPRLVLRRLECEWGPGVCWLYRRRLPEQVEWTEPGAAAPGKDRARRPSAIVRVKTAGEVAIDVTQDVEMWNAGITTNFGWILELDEDNALIRLHSPTWTPGTWKLRITFEPR